MLRPVAAGVVGVTFELIRASFMFVIVYPPRPRFEVPGFVKGVNAQSVSCIRPEVSMRSALVRTGKPTAKDCMTAEDMFMAKLPVCSSVRSTESSALKNLLPMTQCIYNGAAKK